MKFSVVALAAGVAAAANNGTLQTYTTVVTAYTTYCPVCLARIPTVYSTAPA